MKILDKYGIFKECGFNTAIGDMPNLRFSGYDEALQMCYKAGRDAAYIEAFVDNSEIPELRKKIKDLETANARLFERNHELQVDNEESLKEVETQYKIVAAMREDNTRLSQKLGNTFGHVEELKQENLEYSKRCNELRKYNTELARAALKQDIESVPKSKFVITVEEF